MSLVVACLGAIFAPLGVVLFVGSFQPAKTPAGQEWRVTTQPTVALPWGEPAVLADVLVRARYRRPDTVDRKVRCHRERRGSLAVRLSRRGRVETEVLPNIARLRAEDEWRHVASLGPLGIAALRCPSAPDGGFDVRVRRLSPGQVVLRSPGRISVGSRADQLARRERRRTTDRWAGLSFVAFGLGMAAAFRHFWHRRRRAAPARDDGSASAH